MYLSPPRIYPDWSDKLVNNFISSKVKIFLPFCLVFHSQQCMHDLTYDVCNEMIMLGSFLVRLFLYLEEKESNAVLLLLLLSDLQVLSFQFLLRHPFLLPLIPYHVAWLLQTQLRWMGRQAHSNHSVPFHDHSQMYFPGGGLY